MVNWVSRCRFTFLQCVVLAVQPAVAWAQTGRIEGTVRAADSEDPIAGVRLSAVGTPQADTTDVNGYYALLVPAGTYSVRARVVGYQSQVITNLAVRAGGTVVADFQLQPSALRIEGVVVTGVPDATEGIKLPFTVDQVSGEDIPVPPQSVSQAIQGKVAGAVVRRVQGQPGAAPTVVLRGFTSIDISGGRSNQPLYVVDGVILGSLPGDIDGLNIEKIEVVKGAAAAALYGSRAANGVISIATQRGARVPQGDTRFVLRTEVGRNQLARKPQRPQHHHYRVNQDNQYVDALGNVLRDSIVMNPDGTTTLLTPRDQRVPDWVVDSTFQDTDGDGTPDSWIPHQYAIQDNAYPGPLYDQLDLFFDPGSFVTTSFDVRHRSGTTNFLAAAHSTKESGVVAGLEGYRRVGARLNLDHHLRRGVDFHASVAYSRSFQDEPFDGDHNPFLELWFTPPDLRLDSLFNPPRDENDYVTPLPGALFAENPLYVSHNMEVQDRRSRILGSFRTSWRPVNVLDLEADVSFDRQDRQASTFYPRGYRIVWFGADEGFLEKRNDFIEALNGSASARLSSSIGRLQWSATGRVLAERVFEEVAQAETRNFLATDVRDLDLGDPDQVSVSSSSEEIRALGYFVGTRLDYGDRYIADLLVRRDGSSLFGADERWHTYYRVSGAYRLSAEPFWPFAFLDEFKVRYSRGTAGGRPRFSAQYETYAVEGGILRGNTLGNRDLKPEHATETEFGFDLVAAGRLSLSATHARSTVENQILLVPLQSYTGFSNQWHNAGTLENRSWEATLQATLVQTPQVSWSVSVVWDRTRTRIAKLAVPPWRFGIFYFREGESLGGMWGARFATHCGEILTSSGFGQACDQFELNDDGYFVPVGVGNTFTDGINQNLYGSRITIDGSTFTWGYPVLARQVRVETLPDGSTRTDTTGLFQIGDATPDYGLGIGTTLRFKGLTLYGLLEAQVGGDVYNQQKQHGDAFGDYPDEASKPMELRKPITYPSNGNFTSGDHVEDGTYAKLRELSISYTVGSELLDGVLGGVVRSVTLGIVGRNLFTWSGYSGFDPENSNGVDPARFGHDIYEYPNYRTLTMSLALGF